MKLSGFAHYFFCLLVLAALSACSDSGTSVATTSAPETVPEQAPVQAPQQTPQQAPQEKPAITIENAFIKELPPGKTVAAAYMRMVNNSAVTQSLNYVHSPIAESVEIHRIIYNEGMMQMRPVGKLSLNPGESLLLEPGGFHLMVFGIYDPLKAGDSFELNFEFESGEKITTMVDVKP